MYINTALIKEYLIDYSLSVFFAFLAGLIGGILGYTSSFLLDSDQGKWIAMWFMAFAFIGFAIRELSNE